MPLLNDSACKPPLFLRNGHLQTIYPALLRNVPLPHWRRERMATADADFIDLDWLCHQPIQSDPPSASGSKEQAPDALPLRQPLPQSSTHTRGYTSAVNASGAALPQHSAAQLPPLAILCHGLEGSSSQGYMRGMARALYNRGWDVLAWNFRGCSGTPNLQLRSYHSGATDDLQAVISHATQAAHAVPAREIVQTTALSPKAVHAALSPEAIYAAPVPEAATTGAAPAGATAQPAHGYHTIALIGFSLGGNIVLKYLGDIGASQKEQLTGGTPNSAGHSAPDPTFSAARCAATPTAARKPAATTPAAPQPANDMPTPQRAPYRIVGAAAISVPCDLAGSTTVLERRTNRIYMERFLKTLRQKIREKHRQFPTQINIDGLDAIRTFREFDGRYTAPIHGYNGADHYWHSCSCLRSIEHIAVPALLLNAADDPFLSPGCYPADIAQQHSFLHLEMPRHGGHVGFIRHATDGLYYSELRTCAFLEAALHGHLTPAA